MSGVIESAVVAAAMRGLSFVAQCCADIGAALISLPCTQFSAAHLHPLRVSAL